MVATTTKTSRKSTRYLELRQMLEDRRLELMNEVHGKIRDVRIDKGKDRESLNPGESSEIDIQEDIELALIQMKFETLNKINEALELLFVIIYIFVETFFCFQNFKVAEAIPEGWQDLW